MPVKYTDAAIGRMLGERKFLPPDFDMPVPLRSKRGHKERELDIAGASGASYRLIIRLSELNPLDFSIILALNPPDSNQLFRLRRYNGKSHEHTNIIEGNTFYGFHIHEATERYQEFGAREDAYAEPTDRYADFHGALQCLLTDTGFELPPGSQMWLSGEDEA